jgi:uncharacterized protein (TIGR02246 family)
MLLIAACLAAACRPAADDSAEAAVSDVAAIDKLRDTYMQALNAGDVADAMRVLEVNAVWMPAGEPALIGRDPIRAWTEAALEQFSLEYAFMSNEIRVAGDWAFDRGGYQLTITPKDGGEPVRDTGKYIDILRRQSDGSWKYARAIWNSDGSTPDPPPE